jgi:hypothetical protein
MAKEGILFVRVEEDDLDKFKKKCKPLGGFSDVIRDIITALNEGRLRIKPTDGQKKLNEELYNES